MNEKKAKALRHDPCLSFLNAMDERHKSIFAGLGCGVMCVVDGDQKGSTLKVKNPHGKITNFAGARYLKVGDQIRCGSFKNRLICSINADLSIIIFDKPLVAIDGEKIYLEKNQNG